MPLLHANLDTTLSTRCAALAELGEEVGNIIPRMPVQSSAQSLLIQVMRNQTDRSSENEETVENTVVEVILGFLRVEGAAVAEKVDKADGDAAVNIQDQAVFLGGCDGFDSERVIEEFGAREMFLAELFDESDTQIRVVSGLDAMANTGDCEGIC